MNRRSFVSRSALGALAISSVDRVFGGIAANNVYRKNIGIQLYTLRDALAKDAPGTLKSVAAAGYKQVEPFGFPYCQPQIEGAKEAGMAVNSAHFEWASVVSPKDKGMSDFQKIVEQAKEAGLKQLVIPYLHDNERGDLDAYRKIAANANTAAAISKQAGIQLCYHNHAFEFKPQQDGKSGYDIFIEEFSDDMAFEVDVFWIKVGGFDPAEFIGKLGKRVSQLHLKDLKAGLQLPDYGSIPPDAFKELGNGIIPMEPILEAAEKAGVVNCHVEQDHSPDPMKSIRESMTYFDKL